MSKYSDKFKQCTQENTSNNYHAQLSETTTERCMHAKSLSCVCNPMDCSLPGSSVHGISQARILEQAAISYFKGSSWLRVQILVSCISCIGRRILYHWEAPLWRGNPCLYTDVSIISFIIGIHTQIHPFTPVCFLEWDYNLHIVLQLAFCSHNNTHENTHNIVDIFQC